MKTLLFLSILLFWSGSTLAQEHHMMTPPLQGGMEPMSRYVTPIDANCSDPDVPFGFYEYMHCTLHKGKVIDELRARKSSGSCCDNMGECRVTQIYWSHAGWTAKLDGSECRISDSVTIHYDIPLPRDVMAAVCASKVLSQPDIHGTPDMCPNTYCAASSLGG